MGKGGNRYFDHISIENKRVENIRAGA